jgi:hypothetical protein
MWVEIKGEWKMRQGKYGNPLLLEVPDITGLTMSSFSAV